LQFSFHLLACFTCALERQDGTGEGIFLTDNSLGVEIFTLGLLICPNQEVLMNISLYK